MQFRIQRYFLISTLSAVLLVLSLSVIWYTHFSKQLLIDHETEANATMTRLLGKLIWSDFADFVTRERVATAAEMQQAPEISQLDAIMKDFLDGSRVLKVKIYSAQGLVIYSTEHAQIGQDKNDNPGFQSAMRGYPISVLSYRDQFHGFEQTVSDRNLLSTYIPLYATGSGQIAGVFELYSDVTSMVQQVDNTRYLIFSLAAACFLLIFAGLFLLVQRGDRIIRQQYAELANANKLIEQLAYLDSLTQLPNRNSFEDALKREIAQCKRDGSGFALLYMDLDGFKEINDRYGHNIGDLVLHETGKRLRASIRESDLVFRMGGDEFTAVLRGVSSEEVVDMIASKILAMVKAPIHHQQLSLNITISLGVGLYPLHTTDMNSLLILSDRAMYQAKQSGNNCFRLAQAEAI